MRRPLAVILLLSTTSTAAARLPEAPPETLGFDPARLARLDAVVEKAVADGSVPGAVVIVGRRGKIAYARAFGQRALVPRREPMTRETLFDLASLTKPIATATSVMTLVEKGELGLDDPLVRFLPEFGNHGKDRILIEQLLRHRAGLIADNPLSDYKHGPETAWRKIADLGLTYEPGRGYVYSDVGFEILGRVVERLSGKPLDVYARETVFEPSGMADTGFRPSDKDRAAPTETVNGEMLRGVVHDPRARALGGVAGHAGLFSTADDVAVYAQMLLNGGVGPNGRRVLQAATVSRMTDPGDTVPRQRRALGWDVDTPHSAQRGKLFGPAGFGHTGFTGTSLWVDMATQTFVVVLTSRLHPDGKAPSPTSLRSEVATTVAAAIVDTGPTEGGSISPVRCGIDALALRGFAPLKGKRVGLVTNHTGLDRQGSSTIDLLNKAPGVRLLALFSPEHGIRGAVDSEVSDTRDQATGLPVYSLYGKTRTPTAASLEGVDVLVYDIQDVGARFYTYISTLGLVLEAAKAKGIPILVLDRPNPIGGVAVAGPLRAARFESFIAYHSLPVRHGMTVGELARLFNAERKIGAELTVIPCEGWDRRDLYDRTGLLWVNPSPNMRSLTEALLYPGIGLLEATNLATGRGTDTPFERLGAPWIDAIAFARALNDLRVPGVRFTPIRFTPKERQFAGRECGGVFIAVTDRSTFEPVGTGLAVASVLHALYPKGWEPKELLKMLGDETTYEALLAGVGYRHLQDLWQEGLAEFKAIRAKYLIYPEQR